MPSAQISSFKKRKRSQLPPAPKTLLNSIIIKTFSGKRCEILRIFYDSLTQIVGTPPLCTILAGQPAQPPESMNEAMA